MLNALSNEAAMDTLHEGFKGTKNGASYRERTTLLVLRRVLPGVTIFVLARPGSECDPGHGPAFGKSYLQIADGLLSGELPQPFRPHWRVAEAAWPNNFLLVSSRAGWR